MKKSEVEAFTKPPTGTRIERLGPELARIEIPLPEAVLPEGLTGSEGEVAQAIFDGFTNREIAEQRGVSQKTVSNQIDSLFRKLLVSSRAELVLALRRPSD